jgi:hypothetical protein
MDQDKSDHHFRKGKEQEAWKISKVETAKSQTLFPGNLLNYFFVVIAVMVTAQEFIRVARVQNWNHCIRNDAENCGALLCKRSCHANSK